MKRFFSLSIVSLLGMTATSWGAGLLCGIGVHTVCPPPDAHRPCTDPCCHRINLSLFSGLACKKVETLQTSDCVCERLRAASSLGCRLHADFCKDPQVLDALIEALQCDSAWEVRRRAAWSIMQQDGRTEHAIVALFLSAHLDPHYQVRARADEALDILIIGRRACYKDLLAASDQVAKQLRGKYKPGTPGCHSMFESCAAACHAALSHVEMQDVSTASVQTMPTVTVVSAKK